ncbi:hypothetical protein BB560_005930 [Smittium megazygosporum]|uniref:Uncharacterized protein n=1 Tax=Smittium megazygosporum TaxID=133381 RepID=A0A2T9YQ86_9FUNG|nr:hypothetical protein BB560_005930 [Smittium megazygosporum]
MQRVLRDAGASMDDVVKTTVFLADLEDWPEMNKEYARFFKSPAPARSAIQIAKVPLDAKLEIECIAVDPKASRL